jgi:hypothetical protein
MINSVNNYKKGYLVSYCVDLISIFLTTAMFFAVFMSIKFLVFKFCPIFIGKILIFKKPFIDYTYALLIVYFLTTFLFTTFFHIKYMFILDSKLKAPDNGE